MLPRAQFRILAAPSMWRSPRATPNPRIQIISIIGSVAVVVFVFELIRRRKLRGFAQFGTGVFRSRGNNTVDGNTTDTSGTITTFGPM